MAERIHLHTFDLEQDASAMVQLAISVLEHILEDSEQAAAAWAILIADGLRLCREGGRRTAQDLRGVLGQAGISLAGIRRSLREEIVDLRETIVVALHAPRSSATIVSTPPLQAEEEVDLFSVQLDAVKALINQRKPGAALDLLETIQDISKASLKTQVRFHNLRAAALIRHDQLEDAQAELREALALAPDDVTALGNLAQVELSLGHVDIALSYADQVIQVEPLSAGAWVVLVQGRSGTEPPDELRAAPEVLTAIAFARIREKRFSEAVQVLRQATVENGTPQATVLLAQALYGEVVETDTADQQSAQLREALALVTSAAESLRAQDEPGFAERALVTKGQIQRLLGERDAAHLTFGAAADAPLHSKRAVYMLALGLLEDGNVSKAVFTVEQANEYRSHPQLLAMRGRALVELSRLDEAREDLEDAAKLNTPLSDDLELSFLIIESAIEASVIHVAEQQLTLLGTRGGWLAELFRARIHALRDEDDLARRQFQSAIEKTDSGQRPRVQAEFAEYLRSKGEPALAIPILESARAAERPYLRALLARVLYEAHELSKAADLIATVKSEGGALPGWALHVGANIALMRDDLPEALTYLKEGWSRWPDQTELGLRLSRVLIRDRAQAKAREVLANLASRDSLTSRQIIELAELYIRADQPERALPLAYRALSLEADAADVQLAYLNIFLRRESEETALLEVGQVGPNTFVKLESTGEPVGYFIRESGEPDRNALELAPTDPLAQQLIGKQVGETVTLRPGSLSETPATIREIKTHYVHAFQDILAKFPHRHPESTALQPFHVPEVPQPSDFQFLNESAKARQDQIDDLLDRYARDGLPLGFIAAITEQPLAAVYGLVAASPKHQLIVEFGDGHDRARAAALTKSAVVAARSALVTLTDVDLLWLADRMLGDIVIPQSLLDELDEERLELVERGKHGFSALRAGEKAPIAYTIPRETFAAYLARFDAMDSWVRSRCRITPRPYSSFRGDEEKLRAALGPNSYDSMALAMDLGTELFADDLGLRRLLISRGGPFGFSTYALVDAALQEKVIDQGQADVYIGALLRLNHAALLMSPAAVGAALRSWGFRTDAPALRLLGQLRSTSISASAVAGFAVELLREIALDSEGRAHLPSLSLAIFEAALAGRPARTLLPALATGVKLRLKLLPAEQTLLLGILDRYGRLLTTGQGELI